MKIEEVHDAICIKQRNALSKNEEHRNRKLAFMFSSS